MDVKGQLTAASPGLSALGPAPRRPWRPFLPRQPEPEWTPHRWTPRRSDEEPLHCAGGRGGGMGVKSVNSDSGSSRPHGTAAGPGQSQHLAVSFVMTWSLPVLAGVPPPEPAPPPSLLLLPARAWVGACRP